MRVGRRGKFQRLRVLSDLLLNAHGKAMEGWRWRGRTTGFVAMITGYACVYPRTRVFRSLFEAKSGLEGGSASRSTQHPEEGPDVK